MLGKGPLDYDFLVQANHLTQVAPVCFSHELEMLPEEQHCYWKLLVVETLQYLKGTPPAKEIHEIALVPTLSECWFNSSLDFVRYSSVITI